MNLASSTEEARYAISYMASRLLAFIACSSTHIFFLSAKETLNPLFTGLLVYP